FRNDGSGRHCAQSLYPTRRFRPATHRRVCEDELADGIWVLWVKPRNLFVFFERLLPLSLPAFNCRNQSTNLTVARRQPRSDIELIQGSVVILVHPVNTLAQGKVRFCQVRLETQGNLRFGAGSGFPILCGLVIMENLSTNRCKPRMGKGKIRVERDCLHVKLLCSLVIPQYRV